MNELYDNILFCYISLYCFRGFNWYSSNIFYLNFEPDFLFKFCLSKLHVPLRLNLDQHSRSYVFNKLQNIQQLARVKSFENTVSIICILYTACVVYISPTTFKPVPKRLSTGFPWTPSAHVYNIMCICVCYLSIVVYVDGNFGFAF